MVGLRFKDEGDAYRTSLRHYRRKARLQVLGMATAMVAFVGAALWLVTRMNWGW